MEFLFDALDVGERREAGFVAQALDLERRGLGGEAEMIFPALLLVPEIRIDIGAVEDVAGAAGVADPRMRHRQGRKSLHRTRLVVPEQAQLAERYAADLAAAALEIVEHLFA